MSSARTLSLIETFCGELQIRIELIALSLRATYADGHNESSRYKEQTNETNGKEEGPDGHGRFEECAQGDAHEQRHNCDTTRREAEMCERMDQNGLLSAHLPNQLYGTSSSSVGVLLVLEVLKL